MRSPETVTTRKVALLPLLAKELRDALSGRALWTMLLILCPLVGYSFFQALSLYGEASAAARDSPVLATGLSPLDGVLVPTFGAFYVTVTLLFPFVAIRLLGGEKESGALRLLVQLPYRVPTLIAAKMAIAAIAWFLAAIPVLSALAFWSLLGGHLHVPETGNLLLGHFLYGALIAAIALFAAAVSDSAATAAIVTLAFTIGSWVLDFALAGQPGLLAWISQLSLTQTLRPFEQGLLSAGLLLGLAAAIGGFAALAGIWLHPGVPPRARFAWSLLNVVVFAILLVFATQIRTAFDVTEDRRNSFPPADERVLAGLREPLIISVRLAPEDPRYADLRRNVLSKLERAVPRVTVRLAGTGQTIVASGNDDAYGEVTYSYDERSDTSRSTSPREILPLLYGLTEVPPPEPDPSADYTGYPLITSGQAVLPWFLGVLPLAILFAWWWSRRAPRIPPAFLKEGE